MLNHIIKSKDEEKLQEVHDRIIEATQDAIGFDEAGGVLIDPILKTDDSGLYNMSVKIGPETGAEVTMTSNLSDMEIDMPVYDKETEL